MKENRMRSAMYVIVRVAFVALALFSAARGDFEAMAIALIGFVLSVVPEFIFKRLKLTLPLYYELLIVGFIVASLMLGELFDVYSKFWLWDSVLHLSSGVIIGYIGYMILFTLRMQDKLNVSPGMMAFLTFSVSMMVAAMWEVIEFSIDELYGATMQHGNFDTMKDIVLAMIGSVIATAAAYWHHRWPESSPLKNQLKSFFQVNKHLLPKSKKDRKLTEKDLT